MSEEVKVEVKEEELEVPGRPQNPDKKGKEESDSAVQFHCGRCGLAESCHYFGREPYFCGNAVRFAENTFVLKDPFSAETFDVRWAIPR